MNHFLDTVLPTQGRYCVAEFNGQLKAHQFFNTTSEAENHLSKVKPTSDVYIALASFSADRRTAANAHLMRSIFLDLDCGPGKPYTDQAEAATALRGFVSTTNLPLPTFIVNSGGGLHVYWAFEHDLDIPTWGPMARGMKTLCAQHRLGIDPAVTADAARIMRMPGTMNMKQPGNPRPVQLVRSGKVVDVAAFRAALPPPPVDLSAASAFGQDAATESLTKTDLDPCNFTRIVKKSMAGTGCNQIKHALVNAATLEEPLWRAALSIARNCEDGNTAIHKLSKGHPDYTHAATEAKAAALQGKPYTCDWYRENYPDICKGCAHKIGSPITIGRVVPEAMANPDGTYTVLAPVVDAPVPINIPAMPAGYFRGKNGGVYKRTKSEEDGEPIDVEIYAYDLYVSERFYDTEEGGDGDGEQVTLCLHLPKDGIRQFVAPLSHILAPDTLRNLLSKHGVVAFGRQVNNIMGYLASSIQRMQTSIGSHRTRSQMGWTPERHFVVGSIEYTPAGPKLAPPASSVRAVAPWFHQRGDLDTWRKVIDTYNMPGFELLAFAFLVGAGSIYLRMLDNPQVRGGVVHLVSNASGSGKTSVQLAINSLYGHPLQMLQDEKDTHNAKLHALGMFNSICVTIDEITNMPSNEVSELVYAATSGRGKHRMEAQSNKLRVNHSSWCLFTVTSGNAVLSDQLMSNKVAVEGELKRLVELRIPKPEGELSRDLVRRFNLLAANYGVAGPLFIQHVVSNYEAQLAELRSMHEMMINREQFNRTDRFYSCIATCAAMAAKTMQSLNLINFDIERILSVGLKAIRGSKETAETSAGSGETMALEVLSSFVNENIGHMLVINSEASNNAQVEAPRGPLRMRYEPDTHELCIMATNLRDYFTQRRVDFRSSIDELIRMGVLKMHHSGLPTHSRRLASGAQRSSIKGVPSRCYVFDTTKLGLKDLELVEQPARSGP